MYTSTAQRTQATVRKGIGTLLLLLVLLTFATGSAFADPALPASPASPDTCRHHFITVDKVTSPNPSSTFPFQFTIKLLPSTTKASFSLTSPAAPKVTDLGNQCGDKTYSVTEADESANGWNLLSGYPYTYCYYEGSDPTVAANRMPINSILLKYTPVSQSRAVCIFTNEAGPNAAKLSEVQAVAADAGASVNWSTISETGIAGFNVTRSQAAEGPFVMLNAAIIPSKAPGATGGASYACSDSTARPSTLYYFRLESVLTDGTTEALETVELAYKPGVTRFFPSFR